MGDGELGWRVDTLASARIVAPAGRVDESTAGAFGEQLTRSVAEAAADGSEVIAIDLSGVEYMSSRGLRALTLAQRKAIEFGLRVVLTRPNEIMREILAISRYDKVFRVHERNEDALAG
jgi:anti-anti-sigma factor